MICSSGSVTKMLIGLQQVGIVGLRETFEEADKSGLTEREEILDLVIELLAARNYVPQSQTEHYREAIWRELMRYRGKDIRDLYSSVEVNVRAVPGEECDRFVETLRSVFGDYELKPVITFTTPDGTGPNPQLLIDDEPVVKGSVSRRAFKQAVRKRISHW